MKGVSVLLDRLAGRAVAVRLVDGALDDLLVAPPDDTPLPGTILRGVVDRAVKGQGGVFLRLPEGTGYLRGAKGLAPGQPVLAMVTGFAEPGKAVPLTGRLIFKSKYALVTPEAPGLNLSRQIRGGAARDRLSALAEAGMTGSAMGLVIRSDAAQAEDDAVADDIAATRQLAEAVTADLDGPPERLLDGPDAHMQAWRDWGHPDEMIDAPGCLAARGLLDDIAALAGAEVALPGGGRLWVEGTRALVACDVDTGADTSPAAGLKTNLAAVRALPRALRLRGLGGQVVLDPAPMPKKDRRTLDRALAVALRGDPVETSMIGWTPLGHVELTRKRERRPLDPAFLEALK